MRPQLLLALLAAAASPAGPAITARRNCRPPEPARRRAATAASARRPRPRRRNSPMPRPPSRGPSARPPAVPRGDISLDFADTDIREVVAQILGSILQRQLHDRSGGAAAPPHCAPRRRCARSQLLPTLQSLLAQNGATLMQTGWPLPRGAGAPAAPPRACAGAGGSAAVPLRYASAEELAKVLQPYRRASGRKIAADPGSNALLVGGDPQARERPDRPDPGLRHRYRWPASPTRCCRSASATCADFAAALAGSRFAARAAGRWPAWCAWCRWQRINAVLVIAQQPRYIDEARRVFALVERGAAADRAKLARLLPAEQPQQRRRLRAAAGVHARPRHRAAEPAAAGECRCQAAGVGAARAGGGAITAAAGARPGRRRPAAADRRLAAAAPEGWAMPASAPPAKRRRRPAAQARPGGAAAPAANPLLGRARPGGVDHQPDTLRIIPEPAEQRPADLRHPAGDRHGRGDAAQDRHPAAAGAHRRGDRRGDAERPAAIRHAVLLQARAG